MSIYAFDIDGTISKEGKRVHPIICNKLAELAQNNKLIFASARPIRDMLPMLPENLHSSVLIGCNGGMAWESGRVIISHKLAPDFISRMLNIMISFDIPYVLDGEWSYSVSAKPHPFHEYIRSLSDHELREEDILSDGVTKILILSEIHKREILSFTKNESISVHIHRSDGFYDFTPLGNNKYQTLSEIIGHNKYIAFGNDQNDFIMLHKAEISVFIGGREDFSGATYYISMDYIPTLLDHLENKNPLKKEKIYGAE